MPPPVSTSWHMLRRCCTQLWSRHTSHLRIASTVWRTPTRACSNKSMHDVSGHGLVQRFEVTTVRPRDWTANPSDPPVETAGITWGGRGTIEYTDSGESDPSTPVVLCIHGEGRKKRVLAWRYNCALTRLQVAIHAHRFAWQLARLSIPSSYLGGRLSGNPRYTARPLGYLCCRIAKVGTWQQRGYQCCGTRL